MEGADRKCLGEEVRASEAVVVLRREEWGELAVPEWLQVMASEPARLRALVEVEKVRVGASGGARRVGRVREVEEEVVILTGIRVFRAR